MGILWLIIKIILWTILICIGLFILLCTILLIAPIRYEVYLEKYEALNYEIKVRYLGGVKVHFYLKESLKCHQIKVFGKRLYFEEENLDVTKVQEVEEILDPEEEHSLVDCQHEQIRDVKINIQDQLLTEKQEQAMRCSSLEESAKTSEQDVAKTTQSKVKKKVKEEAEREKQAATDWKQMLRAIPDLYGVIKGICKLVKALFIYIKPKQWSFELVVGKEDPADTGELMAKLIMLYPLYYKHGIIKGDYEKDTICGGFLAEGRFCIGGILKRIIVFLWYKPVRLFIKTILRKGKEE